MDLPHVQYTKFRILVLRAFYRFPPSFPRKCPDQFLEALHKMREKDSATAAEKRTDLPDDDDDSKASFEIEAAARSKLVDGCISVYVDKQGTK